MQRRKHWGRCLRQQVGFAQRWWDGPDGRARQWQTHATPLSFCRDTSNPLSAQSIFQHYEVLCLTDDIISLASPIDEAGADTYVIRDRDHHMRVKGKGRKDSGGGRLTVGSNYMYRDGLKGGPVLLSYGQSKQGRIFSQPRVHIKVHFCTEWHITLVQTSRWHQNKSSMLSMLMSWQRQIRLRHSAESRSCVLKWALKKYARMSDHSIRQ